MYKRQALEDRITTNIEDAERINRRFINYSEVDDILREKRRIAKDYLKNNIEE